MRDVDTMTLRDVVTDAIAVFFEYQRDPAASEMAGFPTRSWEAHATHWARILDDKTNVTQTVLVDGRVAGNVASFVQDDMREVGYWLGSDYWGHGVATAALTAFLSHEPRRPLYAHVVKHNPASLRVLQKCGFALVSEDTDEYRLELGS